MPSFSSHTHSFTFITRFVPSVGTPSASHSKTSSGAPSGRASTVNPSPRSMIWNRDARSWKPSGLRAVTRRKRLILEGEKRSSVVPAGAGVVVMVAGVARGRTARRMEDGRPDDARGGGRRAGRGVVAGWWGRIFEGRAARSVRSRGLPPISAFVAVLWDKRHTLGRAGWRGDGGNAPRCFEKKSGEWLALSHPLASLL